MDLALHVADFTPFGAPAAIAPGLVATARAAEQAGFTMGAYAALGVTTAWVGSRELDLPGWVERVGELVGPRLREL